MQYLGNLSHARLHECWRNEERLQPHSQILPLIWSVLHGGHFCPLVGNGDSRCQLQSGPPLASIVPRLAHARLDCIKPFLALVPCSLHHGLQWLCSEASNM